MMAVDGVVGSAPHPLTVDVAGVLEVLQDQHGGAGGDADGAGQVLDQDVGIERHAQQHVPVVGEELPRTRAGRRVGPRVGRCGVLGGHRLAARAESECDSLVGRESTVDDQGDPPAA